MLHVHVLMDLSVSVSVSSSKCSPLPTSCDDDVSDCLSVAQRSEREYFAHEETSPLNVRTANFRPMR